MLPVFVYGTLKPGGVYYRVYCEGRTTAEHKSWTRGKLYHLPFGYPAMTREEGEEGRVYGYLLYFANGEGQLRKLDHLEGYTGMKNSPLNEYEREEVMAYDEEMQEWRLAWCYVMKREKILSLGGVFIPSGWW